MKYMEPMLVGGKFIKTLYLMYEISLKKMSPNLTILTSCEAESKFPKVKINRIFGQPFQGRSWISFYSHDRKQYIKIIVILRGNKNYVVKTVREQNSVGVVLFSVLF